MAVVRLTDAEHQFSGFHELRIPDAAGTVSFEVFWSDETDPSGKGWYWWPCHPGCLPDGDASGPFPTAEGAYLDAIGD